MISCQRVGAGLVLGAGRLRHRPSGVARDDEPRREKRRAGESEPPQTGVVRVGRRMRGGARCPVRWPGGADDGFRVVARADD
jgi:hypothetical protein